LDVNLPRFVSFHDVVIERPGESLDADAFDALFRPFEPQNCGNSRADITIVVEHRKEPFPVPSDLPPIFYFGHVQAYGADDVSVISDRYSRLDLRFDKKTLTMGLCPQSEKSLPGVTQAMQYLGLGLMLREYGIFGLHAAGICFGEHALLLIGDCRVGKTTTTLALSVHATGFLGDDRVLFRNDGKTTTLFSYPREFHVDDETAKAFALSVDPSARSMEGKYALAPEHVFRVPHQPRHRGPITLLFPTILGDDTSLVVPMTKARAYGELLVASALTSVQGVRHRQENLDGLERLVNEGRTFEVHLGRDLLQRPEQASKELLRAVGVYP